MYHVTSYGADPTGKTDSTDSLLKAFSDVYNSNGEGSLMEGIKNLGGVQINLDGGNFMISRPLRLPGVGVGNVVVRLPPLDYMIFTFVLIYLLFLERKGKKKG